jgi:hypothetical protein
VKVRISWQPPKAEFHYPAGPAPRTAVLVGWFRESSGIRVYPNGWCREARQFAPAAIAGTWPQLENLIATGGQPLERAVIVLTRPGEPLLSVEQRERLWRVFRVPVFEQMIGARGQLLASECDAHDGLHIQAPSFFSSFLPLDPTPCACGQRTPRLIPAEPADRVRAVAAYAR